MAYIYLDSDVERRQLIEAINAIRDEVMQILDTLPEEVWYTPRYHGWTPAAMLAHLNNVDGMAMFLMKLALLRIRPMFSIGIVNRLNDFTANLFKSRNLPNSRRVTDRNRKRIAEFITYLPMDRLSFEVWHPLRSKYLTVEQAIQEYLLIHWQMHLETMRNTESALHQRSEDA